MRRSPSSYDINSFAPHFPLEPATPAPQFQDKLKETVTRVKALPPASGQHELSDEILI